MWKKILIWVLVGLAAVFIAIQFVPYGRPITTPPITNQFKWASPEAEAIAVKACYDCHSNQPKSWWLVKIAPFSWIAQSDATNGRSAMNFSAWTGYPQQEEFDKSVQSGKMPPWDFWIVHWDAKLSDAEKKTLTDGFAASLPANPAPPVPAQVKATVDQACSSCHPGTLALGYRATSQAEAENMIKDMVGKGAKVTDAQKQVLITFFTTGK